MKKPKDSSKYSKKLTVKENDKFAVEKRKCTNCKAKYKGTKYQRWCPNCKRILSGLYWVEYE